jgi:EAL domain-containing protein (putative c-di-GMP-specific phosphodiesterase class I)/GGDEF domain-containing protein
VSSDSLIRALPDLVIGIRRDGVILALNAGFGVGELKPPAGSIGQSIDSVWPESVAGLIKQLARKAMTTRLTTEAQFQDHGRSYEVRASAQGPDRAICVIRASMATDQPDPADGTVERVGLQFDRRGFLSRFKESSSIAALREKPLAVAVVQLEGITDIAQAIGPKISERVLATAILRLSGSSARDRGGGSQPTWYVGQLSESAIAMVVESAEREAIEGCVAQACASLREPVKIGDDVFQLTPCAGIAILGQDASSPRGLLDNARAASNEARRGGGSQIRFFTDTLRLKTLARLDIARELHEAIENRDIQLRYVGRHDLSTGRLVAWVGYLRWTHPLRGEIRPNDFLRIAETTGLGTSLSRAAMQWLREDFAALSDQWEPEVRISFGALRHHLSHEDFVEDFERFVGGGAIPPSRLELRISERNLSVRRPADFRALAGSGVQLIVDEMGRGAAAWDWLARAPIQALQLDRAWVVAARKDPVALKVCRLAINAAKALNLMAIAPGIDNQRRRDSLIELGFQQGSGDLFSAQTAGAGGPI